MTAPKGFRRLLTSLTFHQDTTLGWSETSRWCSSTSRAWSITQDRANRNLLSVVRPPTGWPELQSPNRQTGSACALTSKIVDGLLGGQRRVAQCQGRSPEQRPGHGLVQGPCCRFPSVVEAVNHAGR